MSHLHRCLEKAILAAGLLSSWLVCTASSAAQLTIPSTFAAGTPAKAEQVNDNFAAVAAVVNANEQQLAHLTHDPDESFRLLFGEQLVRAYVEQMARFSEAARGPGSYE